MSALGVTPWPNFWATRFQLTEGWLWSTMRIRRCFSAASSQMTREEDWPVGILPIVGAQSLCFVCIERVMSSAYQRVDCKLSKIGSEEDREISVKCTKPRVKKLKFRKKWPVWVTSSDAACVDIPQISVFDYFLYSTPRSMIWKWLANQILLQSLSLASKTCSSPVLPLTVSGQWDSNPLKICEVCQSAHHNMQDPAHPCIQTCISDCL